MGVTLQTAPNRLDFFVRNERFATYVYGNDHASGFANLYAPGNRAVLRSEDNDDPPLRVVHGNINGIAFGTGEEAEGRIVSENMTARRGQYSAGFRQTCLWLGPDCRQLLHETRTARIAPGPGDGCILDLTLQFSTPEDMPVTLGRTETSLLIFRIAASLCPAGGGQWRNSLGDYGPDAMQGRAASWCACVGVVEGDTIGLAILDHPDNPWHPTPWSAREDGTLSPTPFPWRSTEIAPHSPLSLRYRLLVHRGYVNAGWADARLADFARH